MPTTLKNSLTIIGGTGVTASNSGVGFDGSFPAINQQISVGNDIGTTGSVQFNSVTASSYKVSDGMSIYDDGSILGSVTHTGNASISSTLTISGNATIGGKITAERITTELTSSNTIFKSGSTRFGDTIDDTHYITGSLYSSGSFILNGYSSNEISNDVLLGDNSPTAIVTEGAVKTYADTNVGTTIVEPYLRKNFNKNTSTISNNTASFTAFSASAPDGITATSETDFLFFNNGQIMEHDALTIQQSGSNFLLKVDPNSIGYGLENDDEIKAWGRFEASGYLDFDGENDEVTTNFSGSSATPTNKTFSWWMKSTETARNHSVFGHGTNRKGAFTPNFSAGRPLIWNGAHWYVHWTANDALYWDGEWHHWMLYNDVMAITGSKLYCDGTLITVDLYKDTGTVANLLNYTQPLTIGSYQNNSVDPDRHFTGSLMELSIFSGDKTGNASTYYNNGTPYDVTNEDDLQAYWKMTENHGTIAYDYSGEGNHGTIDGATWRT
tara:strand:- start:81 stop:1571 length:1491 start_codon:yes stop_codon:yes gene_type:complete